MIDGKWTFVNDKRVLILTFSLLLVTVPLTVQIFSKKMDHEFTSTISVILILKEENGYADFRA